jgi:hypothetical protein
VFGFLTGVQTPNCIRATAFDAIAHDYPSVVVLSDATAAASDEVHAGTFCYYLEHSHLESNHHVLFLPSIGEHEMPCIWICNNFVTYHALNLQFHFSIFLRCASAENIALIKGGFFIHSKIYLTSTMFCYPTRVESTNPVFPLHRPSTLL